MKSRLIKALETLALSEGRNLTSIAVFREVDPDQIRLRDTIDMLLLQNPWVAEKLTREEIRNLIHWCFLIRDSQVVEERKRALDQREVMHDYHHEKKKADIAKLVKRRRSRISDVNLEMTKERRLKSLVSQVRKSQDQERKIMKELESLRKEKGLESKRGKKGIRTRQGSKPDKKNRIPLNLDLLFREKD